MNLFQKTLLAPGLSVALLFAFSVTAYWSLHTEKKTNDILVYQQASIVQLQNGYQKISNAQTKTYRLLAWAANLNEKQLKEEIHNIDKVIDATREDFSKLSKQLTPAELDSILSTIASYRETVMNGVELSSADMNMGAMVMQSADEAFNKLDDLIRTIVNKQKHLGEQTRASNDKAFDQTVILLEVFFLIAVAVSIIVALIIARNVTRQLGGEPAYA